MAPLAALRCPPPSQSAPGTSSWRHSRPGRLPFGDLISAPRPFPARPIPFAAVSSSCRPSRLASLPASHPGPSSISVPAAFPLGTSPPACCVTDQLGLALALSDPANTPRPKIAPHFAWVLAPLPLCAHARRARARGTGGTRAAQRIRSCASANQLQLQCTTKTAPRRSPRRRPDPCALTHRCDALTRNGSGEFYFRPN